MKVADERSAMLALRPMNHEWGVIDKIESRVEQQMRAVSSIDDCIKECNAMRKPRMQEGVVVRQNSHLVPCIYISRAVDVCHLSAGGMLLEEAA